LQSVTGQQLATRGSMSSYNIAGLISEVSEEVATQIAKNCRRQQPHSHLRSPPRGSPAIIRIYEGCLKSFATQYDAQMTQAKFLCYYST